MNSTADVRWQPIGEPANDQGYRPVRVLVAQPSEAGRAVYRQLLDMDGLELSFVNDGIRAIDLTLRRDFDLVLLDLPKPAVEGIPAIQAIRSTERRSGRRQTPIIVVGVPDRTTINLLFAAAGVVMVGLEAWAKRTGRSRRD